MRQVRRIEPLHCVLAEGKYLSVSKSTWRAVGEIAD
jgi:hypothetical protein